MSGVEHGVHIDPASLPADSDPDRPRLAVDTELKRGHVYAVRIPDGHDVLDYTDPLRELSEATGARLVVFHDGATVQELEATAVVDADAAAHRAARAEVERLRGLLRDVAVAVRGDADGIAYVDRDHDKLPAEIRKMRDRTDQLAEGATCCGHPFAEHSDCGCLSGWAWDANGLEVDKGCECEMRGPLKLAEIVADGGIR